MSMFPHTMLILVCVGAATGDAGVSKQARSTVSCCGSVPNTTSESVPCDSRSLTTLLSDARLLRCRGSLASSAIVGIVVSFLPTCCTDSMCPLSAPFGDEAAAVRTRINDLDSDDPDDRLPFSL